MQKCQFLINQFNTMRKKLTRILLVGLAGIAPLSYANNGYWANGYGPQSKAMAGACVAMTSSALCSISNPGASVLLGNRFEFGIGIFAPERSITANPDFSANAPSVPPGTYKSENDYFFIPHLALNYQIEPNLSIGLTMGTNGMNTEYPLALFQNFGNPMMPSSMPTSPTGISLMQGFFALPISYQIDAQHSIGIAPTLGVQRFKAEGLQPFTFFSKHPNDVTNRGSDMSYGGGVRLGWLWQVNEQLNIGLSYQTKLWMSRFKKYQGLFAEEGKFDIPATYDIGLAYKITPELRLAFNFQQILYEQSRAISNPADLVFMPGQTLLGTDDGLGFGWENANVYKFGLEWDYSREITFRAGYSQSNAIFSSSQALFNVLAPAVVTKHITAGISYYIDPKNEISLALWHAPKKIVHGTNANTGSQTGSIEMLQWELEIGWTMRF
jgi:long-chain fatty acid transport protein